jgi:hypothetical protein
MLIPSFEVESENVRKENDKITSTYGYQTTEVEHKDDKWTVRPVVNQIEFQTDTRVPKLGYVSGLSLFHRRRCSAVEHKHVFLRCFGMPECHIRANNW